MLLAGTLLLAALVWRFAPQLLGRPAAAIDRKPVEAGLYGAAVVVMAVPVAAALVFMVVLFWGWFPGALPYCFLLRAAVAGVAIQPDPDRAVAGTAHLRPDAH